MNFTQNDSITWIIAAILFFFLIRLLVGYLASRKVKTAEDYVLPGGSFHYGYLVRR